MRARRATLALVPVAVAAALALAGCGDDGEEAGEPANAVETGAGTTLRGSVGPGFEIRLEGADGLEAGAYTLVVDDRSANHNFHLTGPGVDVRTDVGGEGEQSFAITLQAGEYRYVCDPHASSMKGSFSVS